MKKTYLLFLGILIVQLSSCQNQNISNREADLDYLATELPQKHCNFFTAKPEKEFREGIQAIRKQLNGLSDLTFALKLQQLVASFGDSHTKVSWTQFIDKKQVLPLGLYWYSDGIYILQTTPEHSGMLGKQLVSINGVPVKTVQDSLSTLITVDNQAMVKKSVPSLLPLVQVLRFFGFVSSPDIELGIKDPTGQVTQYVIEPALLSRQNRKIFHPNSLALCYQNKRAFFTGRYLPRDKVLYMQYNQCQSKEMTIKFNHGKNASRLPSFDEFEEKVFDALNSKDVDKFVFDVRFNPGGNSDQGTEFIKKLSKYIRDRQPNLKTYAIIGRRTFSSAIINAVDFKKMTKGVFVGEETGGKPNHYGEVRSFKLPHSGLLINYSTKYFKEVPEDTNTIEPDVTVTSSFEDFSNGIDPALDWIIKH